MPEQGNAPAGAWNVLLIEDDATIRGQVREYLSEETFASRKLDIIDIADLDQALNVIHERKADLVILDVYRGTAQKGGEQTGIRVLESIKNSGFVSVVLYTALPEGLENEKSCFVRLVGKDAGGLGQLKEEITDLFRIRAPQVHRAIVNHLDYTLCIYMWKFVQSHWAEFSSLANKPEFLRLIVQRLAMTFSREGIDRITAEVYGTPASGQASEDGVHPAECYIKPPIGQDPMLGDIRLRQTGGNSEYLVVLWPTCDMVSSGGRTPKTESVLCARASLARDMDEVADWIASPPSKNKQNKVERLVKNRREESPDRYHFLPGVWDIPDLVADFQALEHIALSDVRALTCLGTLASPFAEAIGGRFQKYIGRIGTPDLDVDSVVAQIKTRATTAAGGGNSTS